MKIAEIVRASTWATRDGSGRDWRRQGEPTRIFNHHAQTEPGLPSVPAFS